MRLTWDGLGLRLFKAGIDHGVLYPLNDSGYLPGIAWNGLTGVEDSSTGREKTPLYSGDLKRAVLFSPREEAGSIKCYTYPDEFEPCLGNEALTNGLFSKGSNPLGFGLCYRVQVGNDIEGYGYAYELHIIYNCYVTEAKQNASTIGADFKVDEMNFGFDSMVEDYENGDPVSHLVISSRLTDPEKLQAVEDALYGTDQTEPRLLLPDELYGLLYTSEDTPIPDWYNAYPYESRYPSSQVYPTVPSNDDE